MLILDSKGKRGYRSVVFDVETIFLFPWAVRYRALGWFGVAEVAVFLAILIVGYIWAYKKGALEWV